MTFYRVVCDICALAGSASVVFGVAQWSFGAACIVGGVLAILWAFATAYALQFTKGGQHDRHHIGSGDPRV